MILRAVEPFVKAAQGQVWEALFSLFDHRYGNLIIGFILHDTVMQDKAAAVFEHADTKSQFYRHTSLAFANPFGMRLEDREDFLCMGHGFPLKYPASNLINLAFSMNDIFVKGDHGHNQLLRVFQHRLPCDACSIQECFGQVNIAPVRLLDPLFKGDPFCLIL